MKLFNILLNEKVLFLNFIIFLSINSLAQTGRVEFGTKYLGMSLDTSRVKMPEVMDHVLMHDSNSKIALAGDESYFTLEFNDKGAITSYIPMMEIDHHRLLPKDYIMLGEYLFKENILYETRSIGKEKYYVKMNISHKWELIDEYKTILGYKCQKAKTHFNTGKRVIPIIAWFTIDIPVSYGPYRYFGLPGLILEIKELGRLHYARKINLNKKYNLRFPDEKFLITKEELSKLY
ncbi:GLPGLI family protein [Mesonia phycicola]|uniref:GLPGLI family protein n=1 Tax=Mesonia phycicola TaxID=579105 RepID=A0A1M6FFQ8_9FLAO|nr:GLPGLI family protein [Mesonia phycicola]SHI96550.1 GLPGLI family protein [Mesonia phycicola]